MSPPGQRLLGVIALFCLVAGFIFAWNMADKCSHTEDCGGYREPYYKATNGGVQEFSHREAADELVARYTYYLAIFTGVLALVSGVQGVFLWRADQTARIAADAALATATAIGTQNTYVVSSIAEAKRAANAMKDLSDTARDTAERQLRAYVSVGPGDMKIFKVGEEVIIEIEITNHGQTPAHKTRHSGSVEIYRNPLPSDFHIGEPDKTAIGTTVIFPGQTVRADARRITKLTTEDISALISTDDIRLYVLGSVSYKDVFGRTRFSQFLASIPSADIQAGVDGGSKASGIRFVNNTEHTKAT